MAEYVGDCWIISSESGAEITFKAGYSMSGNVVGLHKPRPPNLGGRDSSCLNVPLGGAWPVRTGINEKHIFSLIGCSRWAISSVHRHRNESLDEAVGEGSKCGVRLYFGNLYKMV